jgi:hypothetical protein
MTTLTDFLTAANAETLTERLKTGSGMIVIVGEDVRRREFIVVLCRTLHEVVSNTVGQNLEASSALTAVLIDEQDVPDLPPSVRVVVPDSSAGETVSGAIRMATRQDPYALIVNSVPDVPTVEALCVQSSMHLVIAGISPHQPEIILRAHSCTETTIPIMEIIDDGTQWTVR